MDQKISEEELWLSEILHYPVAFAEIMFSNFDNLVLFEDDKFGHVRLGQYPLVSFEYMIGDKVDSSMTPIDLAKMNFQTKKNVGDMWALGGRLFGKTLISLKIDMLISMFLLHSIKVGFSSYDAIHIRGVLDDVIQVLQHHPIFREFPESITKSPNYKFVLNTGYVLDGINMNISGKNQGSQFFQKHFNRLYIEEACVHGHTKIRYCDKDGDYKSDNISYLVNSGKYKDIEVYSYNHILERVEKKKINKAFKKIVYDKEFYYISVNHNEGKGNSCLIVSDNHRLYVDGKYKLPKDIKENEKMYLLDYADISDIQKQILVGCLLGDSHVNKRRYTSLSFTHSSKQRDYIEYKVNCFNSLFCTYRKHKYDRKRAKFGISKSKVNYILRYDSKEVPSLREFNNFKYEKKGPFYTKVDRILLYKYFTEVSLAFFLMDDGSISSYVCKTINKTSKYIYLHTEAFDLETQNLILEVLKNKFDIKGSVCSSKKYYYLAFDSENTDKIINLIRDYIHPTMLYKINEVNNNFIDLSDDKCLLGSFEIDKIEKRKYRSFGMYCFDVEDNHNFFGNGILTGNSMETNEVFKQRRDSVSEWGCVYRVSGMTNFIKYSPCGAVFYDEKKRKHLVNLPQKINPNWSAKERESAIKDFGGEDSINFKIFIDGEVVEEGVSVFDIQRIRRCYDEKRHIKFFEITKESFSDFKSFIFVERPKNVQTVLITADIGETAPSEVIVMFQINDLYRYEYNIVLRNLTHKQQFEVFQWLAITLEANFVGLDCTDGTGRAIFRSLEEVFPKENLIWVSFNEKIPIDFEKNEKGEIIFKNGQPVYREEYVRDWSIMRLKALLYNQRFDLPEDYKFDQQFNSVVAMKSGLRTIYTCISPEDHLFQAFQVFSIVQWNIEFKLVKPIMKKQFAKRGV